MALLPHDDHPHGFTDETFGRLFTPSTDVVFAFHGYPRAIHQLLHGRPQPGRFHVRGFTEQGTTTTPFDMVVLNRMSRYHLTLEALRRARRVAERGTRTGRLLPGPAGEAQRLRPRAPGGHAGGSQLGLARLTVLALNAGSHPAPTAPPPSST